MNFGQANIRKNVEPGIYLLYSSCNDGSIGAALGERQTRFPRYNIQAYLMSITNRNEGSNILVMGGKSYLTLVQMGATRVPGVHLVVLTRDPNLVQDPEVQAIHDLDELKKNIRAAVHLGSAVFINSGPDLLREFEGEATGEFVLYSALNGKDLKTRGEKLVTYRPERQPKSGSYLVYRSPVAGISKNPVTISYKEFA